MGRRRCEYYATNEIETMRRVRYFKEWIGALIKQRESQNMEQVMNVRLLKAVLYEWNQQSKK